MSRDDLDSRALKTMRDRYPDLRDAPDEMIKGTLEFAWTRLGLALQNLGRAIGLALRRHR